MATRHLSDGEYQQEAPIPASELVFQQALRETAAWTRERDSLRPHVFPSRDQAAYTFCFAVVLVPDSTFSSSSCLNTESMSRRMLHLLGLGGILLDDRVELRNRRDGKALVCTPTRGASIAALRARKWVFRPIPARTRPHTGSTEASVIDIGAGPLRGSRVASHYSRNVGARRADEVSHIRTLRGEGITLIFRRSMRMTVESTGGRILVVEDNRINSIVTRRLVEQAGFTADAAYSGKEAARRVADQPYDLVLMDLQLPDGTGIEAARSIREESSSVRNPNVPIVALTAYADAADHAACREVGIETVIEKPIDRSMLAELLHRYVSAHRTETEPEAQSAGGKTEPPTPGSAPPFDAADLETRLGSEQLARTVAARFLDVLDEQHSAVEAALASGEVGEIRAAAHSFASSAANSDAPALHALLRRIETAAAAGESTDAAGKDLAAEVERARRALEEYLG